MIEKARTLIWFAARPRHWAQARELAARKFRANNDGPDAFAAATAWAGQRAVPVREALDIIGLKPAGQLPQVPESLLQEATARARLATVSMGGAGDLGLLHAAVALSGSRRVLETGVAYGWSSLAILSALEGRADARLVSIDMPYPKAGNERFVGVAVPEALRPHWTLIREPDRYGLKKGLAALGETIDLCHYDSDKSWWGRAYAYPLLWDALSPGGVFMSDDIQDNLAFRAFIEAKDVPFAITACEGKYVGIARKP